MRLNLILCFSIGLIILSCSKNENDITQTVEDFYETYNQRQDFKKFLSFYTEEVILEDIINGDRIIGKSALSKFFDWDNPGFKSLESNNLMIEQIIIQDNTSVIKGYFTSFQWGESQFERMHFTTILTFNESKKIVKQVDWINYPSTLVNYDERKNSNKWIK